MDTNSDISNIVYYERNSMFSAKIETAKFNNQINHLIEDKTAIRCLYRPIINVSDGSCFGYASSLRLYDSPFADLFEAARYAAKINKSKELIASVLKNVISVSANGANSGAMFYQPYDFTILQDSYAIKYKLKELNENEYLYLLVCLQKVIRNNYSWTNKAGWERIKTLSIELPVDKDGNILYSYMDKYIEKIKKVNLESIINKDGIVVRWPKKKEEKLAVLNYLITKFEPGVQYKEIQVNQILKQWHSFGDHALLRRELYDNFLMDRNPETGIYWLQETND